MGILQGLKEKLFSSGQSSDANKGHCQTDNLIALGVLLWEVAKSDEKFLPEEKEQIINFLKSCHEISDEDMPIVLRAIEEASLNKIDLFQFTHEVKEGISREARIAIIENLFRVACIDQELDEKEVEAIRKIAGLFMLDHEEFIAAKIKVKKEFGMDVAGL